MNLPMVAFAGLVLVQAAHLSHPIPPPKVVPGSVPWAAGVNPSALPTMAGDVTGPLRSNTISAIRGQAMASPTGSPGNVLAVNGSHQAAWTATPSPLPTPLIENQLGSGNAGYGNSSTYTAGQFVANEQYTHAGVIEHVSCANITGGSCTGAPTFDGCVDHGGTVTCSGTPVTCPNTQTTKPSTITSVALNLAWAAGDFVGLKLVSLGTACNAPTFDADLLLSTQP